MSNTEQTAALLRHAVGQQGPITPTGADIAEWIWWARFDRCMPLLYHLLLDTPTDLAEDQRRDVRQYFHAAMCRCVQLEHHSIVLAGLLGDHGIQSVLLKGGATAHLAYPDPSWREFSDIDLLVRPGDLARAIELIESASWLQGYPLPLGHERFTHAVTFIQDSMELDLHQRIAHRALGRLLPTEDLMARAVQFNVAGTALGALDDVDRFIHSAVHAVASGRSGQRPSSLADILMVAERRPELAEAVLDRAESERVRSLVERGIRDAYSAAQLSPPDAWSEAMNRAIKRRDRLVDFAYLDSRRRPGLEEVAHLRLLEGWWERIRYIGGFFVYEGSGIMGRIRYAWGKLRADD